MAYKQPIEQFLIELVDRVSDMQNRGLEVYVTWDETQMSDVTTPRLIDPAITIVVTEEDD